MAIHYRTEAVILKKHERGEADRVFCCFTKEFGKLHLVAIGERKITSKLRGGLEVLCLSEIEFVEGRRNTIVDATSIERYTIVHSDLLRMRAALRALETLNLFLHGQARDEHIWNLLTQTLAVLNDPHVSVVTWSPLYYYFFWNLVGLLGFAPNKEAFPASVAPFFKRAIGKSAKEFTALYPQQFREERMLAEAAKKHFLAITKGIQ